MVKYCPRCGYPNADEAIYCARCGFLLITYSNQNPTIRFDFPSQTVKFTSKICPRCGTPNVPEANYCKKCGFPLGQAFQQQTVTFQQPLQPTITFQQKSLEQQPPAKKSLKKKVIKAVIADVAVIGIALLLLSVILPYFFDIILLPPLYIPPPAKGVHSLTSSEIASVLGSSKWVQIVNTTNLTYIYSQLLLKDVISVSGISGSMVEYESNSIIVYSIYFNTSSSMVAEEVVDYITSNSYYFTNPNVVRSTSLINGYTVYIARAGNLLAGATAFGKWAIVVIVYWPPSYGSIYTVSQLNSLINDMEVV